MKKDLAVFNDNSIAYFQGDYKVWEITVDNIRAISFFTGMNGDNDTTIIIFFDDQAKGYSLDLVVGIDNYEETHYWLNQNFDFLNKIKQLPIDNKARLFYPDKLFGVNPFKNSISTWLIKTLINAGSGSLKKEIKQYILNKNIK